jgi:2-polyprenyl-6-methoxyphenol hydroxylase-like FAD-dependent oxidoreductase
MHADVLIVGAGPTGLMLANQLARRGLRPLIIDRHPGPSRETRALGVQARTLEIYQHLGIASAALALGKRASGANLWSEGELSARVPLGDIGRGASPFPFLLILGQDDNERLLGDNLRTLGVDVQWNTELVGLVQDASHATATLKQPDGTLREITSGWVAGCDGARSAVRELDGIAFDGAPYENVFFVADTVATGGMVTDELNVYLWREGFHLFFPMRGVDHWRVVGILPADLRDRPGLTFDDVVPSVQREAGGTLAFDRCTWFSTYRIHHRRAAHFRKGRTFLLGDAAHIHSPVGAQGMNTGLQDAYNLAWKLALVVSGRAGTALLDSYEAERVPVAKRLLETTDRAFSLVVSDGAVAGLIRTKVLAKVAALAMTSHRVQEFMFGTISQIGIEYRDSALSRKHPGLPDTAPQPGDRFPWLRLKLAPAGEVEDLFQVIDDTRFTLLLFGQPAPDDALLPLGDLLNVLLVPSDRANDEELAAHQVPVPSFYLLRPDGHVMLAGMSLILSPDSVVRREVQELLHM